MKRLKYWYPIHTNVGKVRKSKNFAIKWHNDEPFEKNTQWENRAELYVSLLKESVRKDMKLAYSPLVLWDYFAEWRTTIF